MCAGTRLGSCLEAAEFEVATTYVNADNTGEADHVTACSSHLAEQVAWVASWNPGFETVEVREVTS